MVPLRAGTLFGTLHAFVPYHLIMREKIHILRRRLITFEEWFDLRFGWFFTNGMKYRSPGRNIPEDRAPDLRPL